MKINEVSLKYMFFTALAAVIFALFIVACNADEGPMEKAGKNIDDAAENVSDSFGNLLEETGDEIEKAADN